MQVAIFSLSETAELFKYLKILNCQFLRRHIKLRCPVYQEVLKPATQSHVRLTQLCKGYQFLYIWSSNHGECLYKPIRKLGLTTTAPLAARKRPSVFPFILLFVLKDPPWKMTITGSFDSALTSVIGVQMLRYKQSSEQLLPYYTLEKKLSWSCITIMYIASL